MRSYGKHVRIREVDGLIITESLRPGHETLSRHSHEFTNVAFVLAGNFHETIGRIQKYCRPYSVVIRPGGEYHANEYGEEGSHCLIIEILPQRLKMLSPLSPVLNRADYWESPWLQSHIMRLYREFQMNDSAALLALDCILLDTLSQLNGTGDEKGFRKPPTWLLKVNDCIHEEFHEPLKLSRIANEAGVHPAHLSKAFRKYFHTTPGAMVRSLRLEFAKEKLESMEISLADISIASGFYDQSHFVRLFKARYGFTPSEYRFLKRSGKSRTKKS